MAWPLHGSNPYYVYEHMCLTMPDTVVDFSVNLNPFGPPESLKQHWDGWFDKITDYPDPDGRQLKKQIAETAQISESAILLGNGGAELISLLAQFFQRKRILIIDPSFSEYERMCQAYNCQISHFTLRENDWKLPLDEMDKQIKENDVLFLCHPNNPTGISYTIEELLKIATLCKKNDCYLVIDEAFYDFLLDPKTIVGFLRDFSNVMILRSLTKMYAIAGLRLGYMLAAPSLIERFRRYQVHWNVNALAIAAGIKCLQTTDYVQRTQEFIGEERGRLFSVLRKNGYQMSNSDVNFYLLRDPQLDEQLPLFRFLLERGLVPRHTANYRGLNGRWLRFSIKQAEQNDRLMEELIKWKSTD